MNKILKRIYYTVDVELVSPLHVSNGEDYQTDSDVMKNAEGECFVPGTSLAGAFRSYLGRQKNQDSIFGFSDANDGKMSSVFVSDMVFQEDKPRVSVRDGVQLDDDKQVQNKYDMEIVETGITGRFRLEVNQREDDDVRFTAGQFDEEISDLFQAINRGDIRFGANKNRGFGRLKVVSVSEVSFEEDKKKEWLEWLRDHDKDFEKPGTENKKPPAFDEWIKGKKKASPKYIIVRVPLKQQGGISIRRYSARPNEADYEHIQCNDKPVIPGNSWNGAVRSDIRRMLRELHVKQETIDALLDQWFGRIKKKTKSGTANTASGLNGSWQSSIVFSESIIEGGRMVPMSRNKINRFTGGTTDGALYSEISCFEGTTVFEYMISKDADDVDALLGIMELVTENIQKGYVAVGGQTAVGRGLFAGNGAIDYNGVDNFDSDRCKRALYELLKGVGK